MARRNSTKITRQQLYEEVWAQPMTKLAPKYGLSDVGLAKVCKRNKIPRPPVGYWVKLAHGKMVDKVPLPPIEDAKPILFHAQFDNIEQEDPTLPDKVQRLIEIELDPANRIIVPERISSPHTRTCEIRDKLNRGELDNYGRINSACAPQIWVSKKLIPRALRVMDTLIKALDERGYLHGIFEQPTSFGIFEELHSKLSDYGKEQIRKDKDPTRHLFYYDRRAEGRLKLEVLTNMTWRGKGVQRNWIDGKARRIEGHLNEFISALIRWAAIERDQRLKWDRWEREREEKERIRQDEARRKAMVAARKDKLRTDARAWERAKNLRRYIDAVVEKDGPARPGSELEKWAVWARAEADIDDPLAPD